MPSEIYKVMACSEVVFKHQAMELYGRIEVKLHKFMM
jgi:hypothetical protein